MVKEGWNFELNQWTLDDIIAWETANTMAAKVPLIAKTIVSTPLDVDLSKPENYKQVSAGQWKELRDHFVEVVTAFFR
jgi:hypothetical protein